MHLSRAAVLAAFVLAASGSTAAAEAYQGPAAYRTAVFWNPADSFWAGELEPQTCGRSAPARPSVGPARLQTAAYEQHGELIGEIRSAPEMAAAVLAQARSCAAEADSATTTRGLITDADRNWALFRGAFSACLARNNAAQYVGSMTLWIDASCNW